MRSTLGPVLLPSLLGSLLFFAAPLDASAQTRVAVGAFSGERAAQARRTVIEALDDVGGLEVVSAGRARDADVIVRGQVRGRRRSARLRLRFLDREGRLLAGRTVALRSRGAVEDATESLALRATDRLRRSDASARAPRPAAARRAPATERAAETASAGSRVPLFEAHVGARLAGRVAQVTTLDGNAHRNAVAYPELTVEASTRPWRDAEGVERGVYVRGFFAHAVGLRSRNTLTDEPVDTSFFRAFGELGILFSPDPAVELGLSLGFGWDAFGLGAQTLVVMPSAEYAYLRPGLRGRFRLEDELLVLDVGLGYRGVLARGALSEHFGEEGETQGFDLVARLGGALDVGLAYGVEAGLVSYFHFFSGDAVTAPGHDGSDVALWLGAHVGFAIR